MSDPLSVSEATIAAAWNVQGDPTRQGFVDEVRGQLGIALPLMPNTSARSEALTALWLGPRSWLLVAETPDSPLAGFTDKRDVLNAAGGALFDLSASRVAYRIVGAGAPAVIASGCPLDLHARAFRAGDCAQSLFGRINVLVHKRDDVPTFTIMVARSFARDAWQALRESAAHHDHRTS